MRNDKHIANNSPDQFYKLLQSIDGIVWEADAHMKHFTFISNHVQPILGFSPEAWIDNPAFWEERIHPDDRRIVANYRKLAMLPPAISHSFEYRMMRADGNIVWIKDNVSLISEGDNEPILRGIMLETTIARRLTALDQLEERL